MEDRGSTRLLYALKSGGPQSADALARPLGITVVAARQHLTKLAEKGLVAFEDHVEGVGRPKRIWSLTDEGHAQFPDRHAGLTLDLIKGIESAFGRDGLDRVIAAREAETRRSYRKGLEKAGSLGERVKRLAKMRSEEGYMAEVRREGDSYLLIENHCPICVAARTCQGFCRSELAVFRDVLGEDAKVERAEHLLSGARRCVYRISKHN